MDKKNLPAIDDLYSDKELSKTQNALNVLLNHDPKPEWIKEHPLEKNVKYIPVERVENLLTQIFLSWQLEVKETKIIANSIVVTVRLHVQDPVTQQWIFQDGIGAMPVQIDKGAAATDFTKVKSGAVMKAAPAAESYALKDAAEKFGKIFGKDLNRAQHIDYLRGLGNRFSPSLGLKNAEK